MKEGGGVGHVGLLCVSVHLFLDTLSDIKV